MPTAEQQLRTFIGKFDAKGQSLIRAVRRAMRARLPTAYELVYDNYNFFVIGYGPTLRPSDCPMSIAAGANGVSLCFMHGARLPDPKKILLGGGSQTRFVRLEAAATLEQPAIDALINAAVAQCSQPFAKSGKGQLVIRSISAKQRPRRRDQSAPRKVSKRATSASIKRRSARVTRT